jgi:calcineurin-like phosphoesterase family protein
MKDKKVWFTSDHHFGHRNIIAYVKRPFENVHDMDEFLVDVCCTTRHSLSPWGFFVAWN